MGVGKIHVHARTQYTQHTLLEQINSHFHHQALVPREPGGDLGKVAAGIEERNGL